MEIGSQKFTVESSKLNSFISFLKRYYFLVVIAACVVFVGLVSIYKLFLVKPTYVYAKIKVGQGMWWASTQKPSLWFVRAIQQAKEQKDLTGKPLVKLITVSYYPYYSSGQYDVYVVAQLRVTKVGGKGTYNFNRETIGVSSPIDLEFPNVQFSGTIIEISGKPMRDTYVEKTLFLTKKYAYPWEFDEIQMGDAYNNGVRTVLQIVDKAKGDTNEVLINDLGKLSSSGTESYRYIIVQAKVQLKKVGNQYLYGEENIVSPGRSLGIVTDNLNLSDYVVAKIE